MRPELFEIPGIHYGVKGYGFMLMIGFLTAIYWASRRAAKVKANPDLLLNLGFVALIFGVLGARLFFVIHYWERNFAGRPFKEVINLTAGGLEFYGGFLFAMLFTIWYIAAHGRVGASRALAAVWTVTAVFVLLCLNIALGAKAPRSFVLLGISLVIGFFVIRGLWRWAAQVGRGQPASVRMYLDIITPSLMWGLAFGRIGCFLNGCCWGALCTNPHLPHAVQFPCASPAQVDQWTQRIATLPASMIYIEPTSGIAYPIPRDLLTMSPEKRLMGERGYDNAVEKYQEARTTGADPKKLAVLESVVKKQEKWRNELRAGLRPLLANMELYALKPSDVEQRAKLADCKSLYVHPAQLYASVNAFLLAFLLNAIFHRRKRHGILVGILFILYPITRIVLEAIRADNPLDTGGLTVSQAVSVAGIVFGILWLLWIYRQPLRSPRAVEYIPPEEPEAKKA